MEAPSVYARASCPLCLAGGRGRSINGTGGQAPTLRRGRTWCAGHEQVLLRQILGPLHPGGTSPRWRSGWGHGERSRRRGRPREDGASNQERQRHLGGDYASVEEPWFAQLHPVFHSLGRRRRLGTVATRLLQPRVPGRRKRRPGSAC